VVAVKHVRVTRQCLWAVCCTPVSLGESVLASETQWRMAVNDVVTSPSIRIYRFVFFLPRLKCLQLLTWAINYLAWNLSRPNVKSSLFQELPSVGLVISRPAVHLVAVHLATRLLMSLSNHACLHSAPRSQTELPHSALCPLHSSCLKNLSGRSTSP